MLDLLQGVGVTVQKDMHLPTITHIVAKKVDDKSQKLVQARRCAQPMCVPVGVAACPTAAAEGWWCRPEFCGHISIVNIIWLLDSIRQRSIQPVGMSCADDSASVSIV